MTTTVQLIKTFQCPGCVCGSSPTNCGTYKPSESYGVSCKGHVLGTSIGIGNSIALGLPRGFNKPGWNDDHTRSRNKLDIRIWAAGTQPEWDHFNIPVWAMEQDGYLFVRTYCPRINQGWVDVIEGGTRELCPDAFDVAELAGDID